MKTEDMINSAMEDELPIDSFLTRLKNKIASFIPRLPKKTSIDVAVEQTVNKSRVIVKDKLILSMALIVGLFGAVIVYNQMPTHILVVVGIVCICFSFSVVTGISRW